MICKLEPRGAIALVRVCDDISTEVLEEFRQFLETQVIGHFEKIVLDMENVDYFCSSALGIVIRTKRLTKERGGDLVMARVSTSVARLMEVTRLHGVIKILSSVEDALDLLGGS